MTTTQPRRGGLEVRSIDYVPLDWGTTRTKPQEPIPQVTLEMRERHGRALPLQGPGC